MAKASHKLTATQKAMGELNTRVRVGGFDYKIEPFALDEAPTTPNDGECDLQNYVLRLNRDIKTVHRLVEVVIHEVSHAVFHLAGLDDGRHNEEHIISCMSRAWVGVYRDNPWLLAWLARHTKE